MKRKHVQFFTTGLFVGSLLGVLQMIFQHGFWFIFGGLSMDKTTFILIGSYAVGFLFSWLDMRFTHSRFVMESTGLVLRNGEVILHSGSVSRWHRFEPVGGRLFLTNQRLYFKSHPINLFNHEWELPLCDLGKFYTCTTFLVMPGGLVIFDKRRKRRRDSLSKFIVEDNKEWLKYLNKVKSKICWQTAIGQNPYVQTGDNLWVLEEG